MWTTETNDVPSPVWILFQVTKEELDVEREIEAVSDGIEVKKTWGLTLYHLEDSPYENVDKWVHPRCSEL